MSLILTDYLSVHFLQLPGYGHDFCFFNIINYTWMIDDNVPREKGGKQLPKEKNTRKILSPNYCDSDIIIHGPIFSVRKRRSDCSAKTCQDQIFSHLIKQGLHTYVDNKFCKLAYLLHLNLQYWTYLEVCDSSSSILV